MVKVLTSCTSKIYIACNNPKKRLQNKRLSKTVDMSDIINKLIVLVLSLLKPLEYFYAQLVIIFLFDLQIWLVQYLAITYVKMMDITIKSTKEKRAWRNYVKQSAHMWSNYFGQFAPMEKQIRRSHTDLLVNRCFYNWFT